MQKLANSLGEPAFQMTIQESLEAVDENSDCSRAPSASGLTPSARFPMMKIRRWLSCSLGALASLWPSTQQQRPTTSLMRIAYLDCFSGMSGDMFMGALVDAGVPAQLFEQTVAALNIGARLKISRVKRNGISAIKVDVYSNGEKDQPREAYWKQEAG